MFSPEQATFLYNAARKYFTLVPLAICPLTFFIDAPFGRFAPGSNTLFLVDGIKAWIVMELVSPILFLWSFLTSPLSTGTHTSPSLLSPQSLLAGLYLIHYANRALISPLRTPSRSKSHISVPLSAILFNTINGSLMGSYLNSSVAQTHLAGVFSRAGFWAAIAMWSFGLVGNIWHDEVLLTLRRHAQSKANAKPGTGEHYAIPYGGLYAFVSYPNYLCEWFEWLGFALAAAPLPTISLASLISLPSTLAAPASLFAPSLTPPYIFLFSEVLLMLPRAVRGHKWYHQRFGASYPPDRRAIIPFLL
ncbi:hypothetical protein H0H81_009409 [Sphagnurus paluster]|uniref:3-oxo-5-alpha-steroid 4-dehydrogenase C-terminal domain-containing protein n=1 Tax=Sphagnurus paluster TaxID=117069 RepID=A0A9P7FVH5_9AGAR|nr:hypothetical protein H0H81_009409 [Sphagnurus paluster]